MDMRDYDVDPDDIMTGLRTAIENDRDDGPIHRYDMMTIMGGGFSVPLRIEGYDHRKKIGTVRRSRLPAWMKDPTLLPKTPPPLPGRRNDDAP